MQILRPVVAQCYCGGRSICNGQSRDFSSLPINNNGTKSMGARVKLVVSGAVLSVWVGFDALASKRRKEMKKMLQDYETAKSKNK
ncbi:unnamed protein product [Arabis nemorensis]|uniref:Uncharacterized protein n=1 Tax=Arabis nemorensis TaxID=586526 RepID=A0A565AW25_9BRAS|nr:unnamed protein product [Arabis nemorensis]